MAAPAIARPRAKPSKDDAQATTTYPTTQSPLTAIRNARRPCASSRRPATAAASNAPSGAAEATNDASAQRSAPPHKSTASIIDWSVAPVNATV